MHIDLEAEDVFDSDNDTHNTIAKGNGALENDKEDSAGEEGEADDDGDDEASGSEDEDAQREVRAVMFDV